MAAAAVAEPMAKRRTPLELRGEQLKRQKCGVPPDALDKKTESVRGPKYINTRVDEVYPARKLCDKWRMAGEKQKSKESLLATERNNIQVGCSRTSQFSEDVRNSATTGDKIGDDNSHKAERCSGNKFLSVKQLSQCDERNEGHSTIDMDKALRGLNVQEGLDNSSFIPSFSEKSGILTKLNSRKFKSEFSLPGCKSPFDFTLKTALRLVSSASVKWCHNLTSSWACNDALQPLRVSNASFSKVLSTWTFPQSSLPSSVISALSLSSSQAESNFLSKRQLDWDDSFRSLYYLLRRNQCSIFYVHTMQFVTMFVGGQFSGKKSKVNAYISQSTTGLRSLLREHDVAFTMPLCQSETVQAAEDDLVEFSEIENRRLGQALHLDAMSEVDGTPQSLLAFIGNRCSHALYDFLLNHRHLSATPTGVDVPVLYSPVPFQNASVSIPEVRYREMRRVDEDDAGPMCYSVELKDTILPPWVVSGLCAAMQAHGDSFHLSFSTEPVSGGLNIAMDAVFGKSTVSEGLTPLAGFHGAVLTPDLRSGFLKELKYGDGCYQVSLSSI
ncbi:downstream neighbor of Son isoform X2 [Wolffia australiana]